MIQAQQRFPKPEFDTGYLQPSPTIPEPRGWGMEYFDVLVLLVVLLVIAWFVFRKRSRRGILWTSLFTLIYFGFYRNGCICSIGAIQNVTLSLFDPGYSISITALLFFLLPLLVSLFAGRLFCAGACPLGAIQDVVIIKPISLPMWLNKTLGLIPYVYLGLAVLYAATGADFIICRYDPFVGIFRMDAKFMMVLLGITFLLMGLFVARPYCRFFCPYGVLLNWTSRFSRRHLTITPTVCVMSRLCEISCPFDAIEYPKEGEVNPEPEKNLRRFFIYLILIPFITGFGVWVGWQSHVFLSKGHPDVYLAELMIAHPEMKTDPDNIDIQTFLSSGKTLDTLVEEVTVIRGKFKTGSSILGGFLGLVIGLTLLNQIIFRKKTDYQPNKGTCFSCGRCMDFCPVGKTYNLDGTPKDGTTA